MGKRLPKMNPEIKALWVAALRSGEYEQGENCLCSEYVNPKTGERIKQHCCLGVLARVADPKRRTKWRNDAAALPNALAKKVGLPDLSDGDEPQSKLIGFNDSGGWSFKKIAAYIERYL